MALVLSLLISCFLPDLQRVESPSDSYIAFLEPARMPGGCSIQDAEHFRNRAYVFRGKHDVAKLVLRDGKARELNVLGTPEWDTELVRQSAIAIGVQSAVLLQFFINHMSGTGSWGKVLIGTCNDRQLTVLFEAEAQGLGETAFTNNQDLVIKRSVWSMSDAQCCPGGKVEERYRWDRKTGRFVRISTARIR